MEIKIGRSVWGCEHWPVEKFLEGIKEAGFDYAEQVAIEDSAERKNFLSLLENYELKYVADIYVPPAGLEKMIQYFDKQMEILPEMNPLLVNVQTGLDYFSFEDNCRIIEASVISAEKHKLKVTHETHRKHWAFHSYTTMAYLDKFPELLLNADFSHWCNVSESSLEGQDENIEKAISRSHHIHARVGHANGPQVNDPRAPEWKGEVAKHLSWWKRIIQMREAEGLDILTITPEFGPPDYQPAEPHSRRPLADIWDVNIYMKDLIKKELLVKEMV